MLCPIPVQYEHISPRLLTAGACCLCVWLGCSVAQQQLSSLKLWFCCKSWAVWWNSLFVIRRTFSASPMQWQWPVSANCLEALLLINDLVWYNCPLSRVCITLKVWSEFGCLLDILNLTAQSRKNGLSSGYIFETHFGGWSNGRWADDAKKIEAIKRVPIMAEYNST